MKSIKDQNEALQNMLRATEAVFLVVYTPSMNDLWAN